MAGTTYSRVKQKLAEDTIDGGRRREARGAMTSVKRHAAAVAILVAFGLLPLAVYFSLVHHPFTPRQVVCGSRQVGVQAWQDYGAKASGAQSIFTIDRVSSQSFPFWLAKLVDTIWDLFVARGMQFVASALSYVVLSNALLATIRSSPVPYRTFSGISINGASAVTVVALVRDLRRHSRRRAVFLSVYSALAIVYVLALPTLLSTMAGYVSTASAYVQVPETSQYVPNSAFVPGFSYDGLPGVDNGTCMSYKDAAAIDQRAEAQLYTCNSTCWTTDPNAETYDTGYPLYRNGNHSIKGCTFFRNETYAVADVTFDAFGFSRNATTERTTYNCNDTVTISIAGKPYPYLSSIAYSTRQILGGYMSGTYCYAGRAYDELQIDANTTCLPGVGVGVGGGDEAGYRWGFSSTLSSIVLIVHVVWCLGMYAVWVVAAAAAGRGGGGEREGELDQLRAVFAVTAAAAEATGLSAVELVRAPRGVVEEVLDGRSGGGGRGGGAMVGAELFVGEKGGESRGKGV
ncbi:uncharacterized protein BKCO1_5000192 [Diplodia corticola]|uniref:Uncharacterized protein n=1 Tax=Diplodia corticola TaxID=236234 RepID=A0A1J9R970_9PEZI|nr:uncharacterized protein BKCO1_5000192 [Diplodia corticola]OJD38086.1 hypothetical protein BKCO1_5000192 [Diplodia corticola]